MKSKFAVLFFLIIISILFNACSIFHPLGKPAFVKVDGTHFELNGKYYYFEGANFWYGGYLGSPDSTGNRKRLIRELDRLKSIGVTNLRILGASENSYINHTLKPAIQPEPGIYNENLLEGLDFLLSEMQKREMHAVIILNNYWEWSGGMVVYNEWTGGKKVNPYDSNYTWSDFMNYSASFYRNEKAKEIFYHYLYKLITRKNKYTGDYYYEDPTIMAWQLANEPRPGTMNKGDKWLDEYHRWIDATAKYIHTLDPNHLVSTGSEGVIGSLDSAKIYIDANNSKDINYLTFHLWPKNWEWLNPKKISETFQMSEDSSENYFNKHMLIAHKLNKPIVMEEFGFPRDSEFLDPGTATFARDKFYKKILGTVYDSAAAGAPIAGTNFWAWGGEGRSQHEDHLWKPGDSFSGDPPHEPQGYNSVFDTDSSTIMILKNFAAKMNELNTRIIPSELQTKKPR